MAYALRVLDQHLLLKAPMGKAAITSTIEPRKILEATRRSKNSGSPVFMNATRSGVLTAQHVSASTTAVIAKIPNNDWA
jgi:hypothetical protein